jgi:hypothetical protein
MQSDKRVIQPQQRTQTQAQPQQRVAAQPQQKVTAQPTQTQQRQITPASTASGNTGVLDKMSVQGLMSSVGVNSSNLDDILEGTVVDVENRIARLKTKLDENEMIVKEEKAQIDAKMKGFNDNLASQIDLYNAGGGDNDGNLFSQLKVYRGAMLVDTKQWLRKGIENKLNIDIGLHDLSTDDSKETFLNKLNDTRIFKDEAKETKYLSMVRDIQTQRRGSDRGADISMVNSDLKQIQQKYITELQGLLNSVGADRPYYTGVREAGIEGYQTNSEEGYLQLPVIMNSARYKNSNKLTYLHHGSQKAFIGFNGTGVANGNAPSLLLSDIQGVAINQIEDRTPITRTRGSQMALFVNQDVGGGDSSKNDFKLTEPVSLGENEINPTQEGVMVKQQTVYDGMASPPDVSSGTGKTVRAIVRGNGTYVEAVDPRKCLAGMIPFDESLFTNLLNEKSGGLIQDINSLTGVSEFPIKWRGNEYTIQRGKDNSLFRKIDELKGRKEIFPLLKKGISDTSDINMIKVLDLAKICQDFEKDVLKCNDGGDEGWEGLGWLFRGSTNDEMTGGDFNPNFRDGGVLRHLMTPNSQNLRVVVKKPPQGVGGLQLNVVYNSVVNHQQQGGQNPALNSQSLDADNYDNLQVAYQKNGRKLIDDNNEMEIDDWNSSESDSNEERKNIAEMTRRRCILFLFHFLEKAFNATWYCVNGREVESYKVNLNPQEVYNKLKDWDSVQKWWSYTKKSINCVNNQGAVCTYRGENNNALPETMEAQECLLSFARHLFIGRGNPDPNTGSGCRNAWENDAKLWDIIEAYLPKFYRCAIMIKHKETIKTFYSKLNTLKETSPILKEAQNVGKDTQKQTYASDLKLLEEYPQDVYRDLMVRMYDIDAPDSEKRYCCCKTAWSAFTGGKVEPVAPCDICAVAHYFFDMPEASSSYDFRLYQQANPVRKTEIDTAVDRTDFLTDRDDRNVLVTNAKNAVSEWHNYTQVTINEPTGAISSIVDESGELITPLEQPFSTRDKQKESRALEVITFDKNQISKNFGSYVVNDENYAKLEAEYKLTWPKEFVKFEYVNGDHSGKIVLRNPKPPTNITTGRKSHIQRHCKLGTPPYPIKHLAYKLYLKEKGPLFFDMKRVHGQAKNILINYISGWESKKERYDIAKQKAISQEQPTGKNVDKIRVEEEIMKVTPDSSGITSDMTISAEPGLKDDNILDFEAKTIQEPKPTTIENAMSKQVVEFSDYKQLEDEYNRVKQEIDRRNSLLEDMLSSYRENKMIRTSDRTAQRMMDESDKKRILKMKIQIKELERKQQQQLDFLRVTMSRMQERYEIYKKQNEEINRFKEEQRRSQMEAEMNRLVAKQKEKDSQHMQNLHIQKLRKKQGEYLGLSDESVNAEYDLLRMKPELSYTTRSLPPIYSETTKSASKPKKRTQSKKRANKKNSNKKKKTPKKD